MIGISTVRDRILQRFLLQQVYPDLEATFSEGCYAYRPGYSIYLAIDQVMERYRHQPAWVVKADIQKFFDHLSWSLLLSQLEQLDIEPLVVRLVDAGVRGPGGQSLFPSLCQFTQRQV
ncbi:reverse transcriptase domain-containing protein [Leptothoe sp. PORK10 BA2]|uniref:reverse transcriptase domain-containing protein n=1 Tax=Leptothoe sp. PORK10 BA2 TaxID=3110254 RepID=UPI003FA3763B